MSILSNQNGKKVVQVRGNEKSVRRRKPRFGVILGGYQETHSLQVRFGSLRVREL